MSEWSGMPNTETKRSANVAAKDYWLDENREIAADESTAAYLLIRQGQEVTDEMARKYPTIRTVKKNI